MEHNHSHVSDGTSAHHEHGHMSGTGHNHSAHHGHHHHGASTKQGSAFAIAIVLNSIFVVIEFVYGFIASSTALMADAGHNLSDVLGLALAWGAAVLALKAPNNRFTYGLRSSSTLVALANAVFLLVSCGAIGWEAVQRLWETPTIDTGTVMVVATIGIVINGFSAMLFMKGSEADLNVRGAYLHMAADALISVGVVAAAVLIRMTGWSWLDPLASMLIIAVIIRGTWALLRESLKLALHAVPEHIDIFAVEAYLRKIPHVTDVHDLHIWGMSTTESALTVHLVVPTGYPGDELLDAIATNLKESFSIQHSTIQIEHGSIDHACSLHSELGSKRQN